MLLVSIFTGWLLSASFAPIDRWYLAPLAVALWLWILSKDRHSIFNSLVIAFTFNAFLLHWSSIYVGSTPWLVLAFGEALLFLPLAWARGQRIYFFPLIFIVMEEIRSRFPFGGFGWARLAFSQAEAPYRSVAAIGGVSLLSAMVLLIGFALFFIVRNIRVSAFVLLSITGILFISSIAPNLETRGVFRALLVQGNVPQLGLDFNARAKAVFDLHIAQTQEALRADTKYQVIIWPENSVDVDPFTNSDVRQALGAINTRTQKPVIIGAVLNSGNSVKNASILWNHGAKSSYIKQHITPFGEYIPLRALARYFSPYVDQVNDFDSGTKDVFHQVDNVTIAPIICYELIDDSYINRISTKSDLLVVQTNNATFGTSAQSIQQLSISRIRAIENHRDLLSVSTTGISGSIDADGNIKQVTVQNQAGHLFTQSNLYSGRTWANYLGWWSFWLLIMGLMLIGNIARRLDS